MKCPACSKELRELRVDDIVVDVCDRGCGGIWFDAFELHQADEVTERAGAKLVEALGGAVSSPAMPPDQDAKRECPRCAEIKLKKHFFSPKRRVRVDQCPNCAGYWLDQGELQAIREETHEKALEKSVKPREMSMDEIRRLYRMRIEERETGRATEQQT